MSRVTSIIKGSDSVSGSYFRVLFNFKICWISATIVDGIVDGGFLDGFINILFLDILKICDDLSAIWSSFSEKIRVVRGCSVYPGV